MAHRYEIKTDNSISMFAALIVKLDLYEGYAISNLLKMGGDQAGARRSSAAHPAVAKLFVSRFSLMFRLV